MDEKQQKLIAAIQVGWWMDEEHQERMIA